MTTSQSIPDSKATDRLRERIREEIERRGMTIQSLANASGLSRVGISRVLNGHSDCTILFAEKIADSLEMRLHELLSTDLEQKPRTQKIRRGLELQGIRKALIAHLSASGESVSNLAVRAGVKRDFLYRFVNGTYKNAPSFETMVSVVRAIGCSLAIEWSEK